MRQGRITTLVALAFVALLPSSALAAPPANDNRANAQQISGFPATVNGTTVDATREENERGTSCAAPGGSVWYRVSTPAERRGIVLDLSANGNLDAVVDVFRQRRSRLQELACGTTGDDGKAQLELLSGGDETFLIRVAPLSDSPQDNFQLQLRLGEPTAKAPGAPLPKRGATGSLNRVLNPNDADSVKLKAGETYRFNLASSQCTRLEIYAPGTSDFDEESPVKSIGCRGYTLFTPDEGQSGRYSLLAVAPGREGTASYRLTAGKARADDAAPGRFIRNYQRVKGSVNARKLDVVDLYRFDVTRRSDLDLRINSGASIDITLLNGRGKRITSSTDGLTQRLGRGRYFAVVRAERGEAGKYTLRRISRSITRTVTTFNGRKRARVAPGQSVALGVHVRPGTDASGKVKIRVEHFDPVAGWQFFRTYHRKTSSGGDATIPFARGEVGRWRAASQFRGSRGASPSESGYSYLTVQRPLEE